MAEAKKCDICGKYYEPYNYPDGNSLMSSEYKDIALKPNAILLMNDYDWVRCAYRFMPEGFFEHYQNCIKDCCPECMAKITTYIESLGGNNEND